MVLPGIITTVVGDGFGGYSGDGGPVPMLKFIFLLC